MKCKVCKKKPTPTRGPMAGADVCSNRCAVLANRQYKESLKGACCECKTELDAGETILWPGVLSKHPSRSYCQPCYKKYVHDAGPPGEPFEPGNRRKEAIEATRKKRGD